MRADAIRLTMNFCLFRPEPLDPPSFCAVVARGCRDRLCKMCSFDRCFACDNIREKSGASEDQKHRLLVSSTAATQTEFHGWLESNGMAWSMASCCGCCAITFKDSPQPFQVLESASDFRLIQ